MNSLDLTPIKQALITKLQSIQRSNGYETDVNIDWVRGKFSAKDVNDKTDRNYPKIFVLLDEATFQRQPSYRVFCQLAFVVSCLVKQQGKQDTTAQEKIETLIKDIDKLFGSDVSLGGLAEDMWIENMVTDAGYADPEGVAIFRLRVDCLVNRQS